MDDEIYKENILDHYRHPRHHGVPAAHTIKLDGNNPSCGDAQTLYLSLEGTVVSGASFVGDGCAISQAGTSMLLEKVAGKSVAEILVLSAEDMRTLLGVPIGESREKCMMLGLSTLQRAVKPYA